MSTETTATPNNNPVNYTIGSDNDPHKPQVDNIVNNVENNVENNNDHHHDESFMDKAKDFFTGENRDHDHDHRDTIDDIAHSGEDNDFIERTTNGTVDDNNNTVITDTTVVTEEQTFPISNHDGTPPEHGTQAQSSTPNGFTNDDRVSQEYHMGSQYGNRNAASDNHDDEQPPTHGTVVPPATLAPSETDDYVGSRRQEESRDNNTRKDSRLYDSALIRGETTQDTENNLDSLANEFVYLFGVSEVDNRIASDDDTRDQRKYYEELVKDYNFEMGTRVVSVHNFLDYNRVISFFVVPDNIPVMIVEDRRFTTSYHRIDFFSREETTVGHIRDWMEKWSQSLAYTEH